VLSETDVKEVRSTCPYVPPRSDEKQHPVADQPRRYEILNLLSVYR